jgi:hypothetical protein
MVPHKSVICFLLLVVSLSGCGTYSAKDVLGLQNAEILYETETEYGKVVFYKTDTPENSYGARLIKKNGFKWEEVLGSSIHGAHEAEDIAWGWQTSKAEPVFVYGTIKNNDINKLTINTTDAVIINSESGDNLFYLLTNKKILVNQQNGEEGTQIYGFSEEDELIYQRLP